jgi:dihydroceramide fatty acyl 2-hydroxylase
MTALNVSQTSPRPRHGSARMFESDFFERFSRVHPAVPALLYLPVMSISLWEALRVHHVLPGRVALQFAAGYLLWTLLEYWLHRFVFHVKVVGPKTQRLYFLLHGVHHDYPWDTTRLVFPPGASLILGCCMYALFRWTLGETNMYGPFAGLLFGYVIYDTTHWYIHARTPKSAFGRWVRREHLLHHFNAPASRFGVSCPWLDYVFGTRGTAPIPSNTAP